MSESTNNLHFKKIRMKNLGTVGDNWLEIQLDRNVTTMVYGDNGVGKSMTMLDSIMYALFGKPFKKIKIGDMVNTRNQKGMEVEITFFKGKDEYLIQRGYKPAKFVVYKNKEILPHNNEMQEYLEEHVIGVPYNTFKQIVVMGKANYQSFFDIPKDKRREFVETILDISVFREMLVIHKENVKAIQAELQDMQKERQHIGHMMESTAQFIRTLTDNVKESQNKELTLLDEEIKTVKDKLKELLIANPEINKEIQELEAGIKKATDKIKQASDIRSKVSHNKELTEKMVAFLANNQICPTCKQEITEEHKSHMDEEHSASLAKDYTVLAKCKEVIDAQDELREEYTAQYNNLMAIRFNIKSLEQRNNELNIKKSSLIAKMESSTGEKEDHSVTELKEKLAGYIKTAKEIDKKIKEIEYKQIIYGDVSNLLSDSGIKAIVINKYLSQINHLINKYLTELGLFATVYFDEEFKDTIKKRGFDDFSFNQLSEGEKLRVDLAIMMAWRDIASMKSNLTINLLIMDEVFNNSMDFQGSKAFIDILNSRKNQNTFIISPNAEEIIDMCHSSIKLTKEDGFATISYSHK